MRLLEILEFPKILKLYQEVIEVIRKKISLGILLVLLGLIATGQAGTSGCQCGPSPSTLSYEYKVPYCTANNENDRVALLCYIEVHYYDAQDAEIGKVRKDLVKVIRGDTIFGELSEQFPPVGAVNLFKRDSVQLNIPDSAVKAKVIFHVGGYYLLDDNGNAADQDDGIEALLKNVYLGTNKVTGWEIASYDDIGIYQYMGTIEDDGTLWGKIIGGKVILLDQGFVTFSAEVPLT